MLSDEGKNFPVAKSAADRVAAKAAELLDADQWDDIRDTHVVLRGVTVYVDINKGWSSVRVPTGVTERAKSHLAAERPDQPFAEIVVSSVEGAMRRERERLLKPTAAQIENNGYAANIAADARRKLISNMVGYGVVAALVLGASAWAWSALISADRAARADANRVNEYGFRKGDLKIRITYPDDCGDYNAPRGLEDCKLTMQRWEREGQIWLTVGGPDAE